MFIDLTPYSDKRICVAVSGGKDSMALLHYILTHAKRYGITLSALNCDHGIRGEASERDSAFVKAYCGGNCIPLYSFKAEKGGFTNENNARIWRMNCYLNVLAEGKADLIATAHHLCDNAESVLFNLARGASVSGVTGISDSPALGLIRPMIGCSRGEIDGYIDGNKIPFVTDESNLTDDYTRNKIRHSVLPALEEAVPGAIKNIFRFSRIARETEECLRKIANAYAVRRGTYGYLIKPCEERAVFKCVAREIVAEEYKVKDYTAEHLSRLYDLQSAENGKKFEFLGLVAVKEEGGVAIVEKSLFAFECDGMPFFENLNCDQINKYAGKIACAEYMEYADDALNLLEGAGVPLKTLEYDIGKIPENAVIRFRKAGDKFTKFGGGTKSLSDYLTDKKVPQSMRSCLPLVCDGSKVLIVGGVEISNGIRTDEATERKGVFICADPFKIY